MSEPAWVALGAVQIDYEGPWAAGTAYAPGDVVTYAGVTYLAVNPSTGQTPPSARGTAVPVVTALPGSPLDGDEVILVDSLIAPTYQWRLRYMASITDTYKWIFIGGPGAYAEVLISEVVPTPTTWQDAPTVGPSITLARAGIYEARGLMKATPGTAGGYPYIGPSIAGANPVAGSESMHYGPLGGAPISVGMLARVTVAAGQSVRLKYQVTVGTLTVEFRKLSITPMRVS